MRNRGRRRMVIALVAVVVFGLLAVAAYAATGRSTARVVAATKGTQSPVTSAAHSSPPTTRPHRAPTTVKSVATTATVPTTLPRVTTPTTARAVWPTSAPTVPASTSPPVTRPPTTAPPKTVSLHVTPGNADFPSTPPPYWPMPIVPVTITNTGSVAVRAIVVHPVGVYSVPSSTCSALSPGQSCVAQVQFCPSSPGQYLNTLMITGTDALTATPIQANITLHGTAT